MIQCPNCQAQNREGSQFCQSCGSKLLAAQAPLPPTQQIGKTPAATPVPPPPPAGGSYTPGSALTPVPVPPPSPVGPAAPSYQPAAPAGNIAGNQSLTTANIWGPFAGYGERRRHVAWLIDNQGHREADLHRAVNDRFQLRQVAGSTLQKVTLTARGLLVEQRPYFFVQRGITTAALYIVQFGKDLYISQATYVKSPVSNARIAALVLMLLYYFIYPGWLGARFNAFAGGFGAGIFGGGGGPDFPIGLLCLGGPLYLVVSLVLLIAFVFTLYKILVDKDPLAAVRTRPDEFNQDDVVALEKAVEETVRQSLDAININAALLTAMPQQSYGSGTSRLI